MKTQMPPAIYWCPFCDREPYKSKGNLNNHVTQSHEPQKEYFCNACNKSWNTALCCTRHFRRSGCSNTRLETRHHELKKKLFACGLCIRPFDDFGLRQDHLFTHQQDGMQKDSWRRDNVMRSLLSHPPIAERWGVAVRKKLNNSADLNTIARWEPCWDWSGHQADDVVEALEYMRFSNQRDLDMLLNVALSALTSASEQQLQAADQQVQQGPKYTCFDNQQDFYLPQDNFMPMLTSLSQRQLQPDDHEAQPESNTELDFAMPGDKFEEYLRQIEHNT